MRPGGWPRRPAQPQSRAMAINRVRAPQLSAPKRSRLYTLSATSASSPVTQLAIITSASRLKASRSRTTRELNSSSSSISGRSEEHTSELQSLMRTSYAVFCLNKKTKRAPRAQPTDHKHKTKIVHYDKLSHKQ